MDGGCFSAAIAIEEGELRTEERDETEEVKMEVNPADVT